MSFRSILACCNAAAQQADFVEGSNGVDLHHVRVLHDSVLTESGAQESGHGLALHGES